MPAPPRRPEQETIPLNVPESSGYSPSSARLQRKNHGNPLVMLIGDLLRPRKQVYPVILQTSMAYPIVPVMISLAHSCTLCLYSAGQKR